MNKISFLSFFLLFSFNVFSGEHKLPEIFYGYSFLYDSKCQKPEGYLEIKEKGLNKLDSLKLYWNEKVSQYFQVLFDQLDKGFQRKELTATVTFCGNGSYSYPLVIDLYNIIKFAEHKLEFFSSLLVFHELLHTYVVDNVNERWPTPLIQKYVNEDRKVKSHLHLMALQLYALNELDLKDEIFSLEKWYKGMGGPYARSWEIITTEEDYNDFVNELK